MAAKKKVKKKTTRKVIKKKAVKKKAPARKKVARKRAKKKSITKRAASKKRLEGKKKRLANLIPAKPGEVRNPKGRPPKGKCFPDLIRRFGAEVMEIKIKGKKRKFTREEALIILLWERALAGQPWAINTILERTEGKPTQPIDVINERQRKLLAVWEQMSGLSDEQLKQITGEE